MPVERGTFKSDRERPKTLKAAQARIAEQKAEAKVMNAKLRKSRGQVSIARTPQSKTSRQMNRYLRGEPEPAEEFTQDDITQVTKDDMKTLKTIDKDLKTLRAEKISLANKRAALGSAAAGTGSIMKRQKSVNQKIRDAMAERRRLGL